MIELLQHRKLFSATLNDDGLLEIVGTDGDDVIRVQPSVSLPNSSEGTYARLGGDLVVRINGVKTRFDGKLVKQIKIAAGDGNDAVRVDNRSLVNAINDSADFVVFTDLAPVSIEGGNGNDSVTGSFGKDTIRGGPGDDVIYGGLGRDKLYGNDGDDRLYDTGERDVLVGGAGSDVFNINANSRFVGSSVRASLDYSSEDRIVGLYALKNTAGLTDLDGNRLFDITITSDDDTLRWAFTPST